MKKKKLKLKIELRRRFCVEERFLIYGDEGVGSVFIVRLREECGAHKMWTARHLPSSSI
jgi:hypothetical protein